MIDSNNDLAVELGIDIPVAQPETSPILEGGLVAKSAANAGSMKVGLLVAFGFIVTLSVFLAGWSLVYMSYLVVWLVYLLVQTVLLPLQIVIQLTRLLLVLAQNLAVVVVEVPGRMGRGVYDTAGRVIPLNPRPEFVDAPFVGRSYGDDSEVREAA